MEKTKPSLRWYEFAIQVGAWVPFIILRIILILIGWIVVPIAAACEAYVVSFDAEKSRKGENPMVLHFTWKWLFLWDNWEDGIANETYWKAPNTFLQIIYWSCRRNPVNNLRRVPYLSLKINPLHVRYWGSFGSAAGVSDLYDKDDLSFWYYCWHGVYSNFRVHFKLFKWRFRFWIGFKIYPGDINGVTDHRKNSAGFANQLKPI